MKPIKSIFAIILLSAFVNPTFAEVVFLIDKNQLQKEVAILAKPDYVEAKKAKIYIDVCEKENFIRLSFDKNIPEKYYDDFMSENSGKARINILINSVWRAFYAVFVFSKEGGFQLETESLSPEEFLQANVVMFDFQTDDEGFFWYPQRTLLELRMHDIKQSYEKASKLCSGV